MIIEQKTEEVHGNVSNLESIKFRMDTSDAAVPLLIDFLSNLYSNPKQTICHEYVSNARDSHFLAGKQDTPIKIVLPTKLNPYYSVRDYGIGMDHDEVKNIFSVALKSTKRDSNDTIGGFGVGKLVFSPYCGVMFLTTWKHGEKTVYQCRLKDGDGEITPIFNEPSDEPQGVEIKIPIKESDFYFFQSKAEYSYAFLPTKPIIKGLQEEFNHKFELETDKFSVLENYISGTSSALVTIGGIPFPVIAYNISHDLAYSILNSPVALHFNVGEIEHTPARDALKYSDKTCKAIEERLDHIKNYLIDYVSDQFKGFTTMYEARNFLSKLKAEDNGLQRVTAKLDILKNVTFNGKKIDLKFKPQELNSVYKIHDYELHSKSNRLQIYDGFYNHGEYAIVVPYDFQNSKRSKRIKKYIIDNDHKRTSVIFLNPVYGVSDLVSDLELPNDDLLIDINDLLDPVYNSVGSGYSSKYSSRTVKKSKVLTLNDYSQYHDLKVDSWDESEMDIENESGVYVFIKYYKPEHYDNDRLKFFMAAIDRLHTFDRDFKLIGIRSSEKKKVEKNKNLIHIDDYIRERVSEIKAKHETNIRIHQSVDGIIKAGWNDCEDIECEVDAYIKKNINRIKKRQDEMYNLNIQNRIEELNTYRFYFGAIGETKPEIPNGRRSDKVNLRIQKAKKYFWKKYPILNNYYIRHEWGKDEIEYVKAMNFFRKSLSSKARSSILSV